MGFLPLQIVVAALIQYLLATETFSLTPEDSSKIQLAFYISSAIQAIIYIIMFIQILKTDCVHKTIVDINASLMALAGADTSKDKISIQQHDQKIWKNMLLTVTGTFVLSSVIYKQYKFIGPMITQIFFPFLDLFTSLIFKEHILRKPQKRPAPPNFLLSLILSCLLKDNIQEEQGAPQTKRSAEQMNKPTIGASPF
ncbi:hypothetical protein BLNAU_8751 [Blattamonas nauphoetae]|uniref:Uncharacterized protein n=1 Tax=Blattamonas nauphoetae TaxID=2049346 RepID=A0ABQ9XXF7_9EUKA|nr:hypothetical protein BLNAU_8751 [Blattamonas nauphoetae]